MSDIDESFGEQYTTAGHDQLDPPRNPEAKEATFKNQDDGGLTIDGKKVLKMWESFSGWYWYGIEDTGSYEYTDASGNTRTAHSWFGFVQGFAEEWGSFDENELNSMEGKVWEVPRENWHFSGRRNTYEAEHDGTVWSDFHQKWIDEDELKKDRKARGFGESKAEEHGWDLPENPTKRQIKKAIKKLQMFIHYAGMENPMHMGEFREELAELEAKLASANEYLPDHFELDEDRVDDIMDDKAQDDLVICRYCGKKFDLEEYGHDDLNKHLLEVHNILNKGESKASEDWQQHLPKGMTIRGYECPICFMSIKFEKEFGGTGKNLYNHLLEKHGVDDSEAQDMVQTAKSSVKDDYEKVFKDYESPYTESLANEAYPDAVWEEWWNTDQTEKSDWLNFAFDKGISDEIAEGAWEHYMGTEADSKSNQKVRNLKLRNQKRQWGRRGEALQDTEYPNPKYHGKTLEELLKIKEEYFGDDIGNLDLGGDPDMSDYHDLEWEIGVLQGLYGHAHKTDEGLGDFFKKLSGRGDRTWGDDPITHGDFEVMWNNAGVQQRIKWLEDVQGSADGLQNEAYDKLPQWIQVQLFYHTGDLDKHEDLLETPTITLESYDYYYPKKNKPRTKYSSNKAHKIRKGTGELTKDNLLKHIKSEGTYDPESNNNYNTVSSIRNKTDQYLQELESEGWIEQKMQSNKLVWVSTRHGSGRTGNIGEGGNGSGKRYHQQWMNDADKIDSINSEDMTKDKFLKRAKAIEIEYTDEDQYRRMFDQLKDD